MKRPRPLHLALPLLLLTLLTLPTATTGSKYIWNVEIPLTLEIQYADQSITSLFSDMDPLEADASLTALSPADWTLDLTNIRATVQAEGVVLTAESGHTLPEAFTVRIGDTVYPVRTDGQTASPDLSFDPATGLLTVSESLWEWGVTVEAAAVPAEDPLTNPPARADDPTIVSDGPTDPLTDESA